MVKDADKKAGQDGAEDLRQRLFDRYRAPLLAFFNRRTTNSCDSEDLAHEVIYRMLQREELSDVNQADAFIFTTARNLLRDRARRAEVRDRNQSEIEATNSAVEVITPERVLQGRQDLSAVIAALSELDEKPRDMFILHRFDGMKHREIAEAYGLSVSSVEKYLMKAFAHVMKSIEM